MTDTPPEVLTPTPRSTRPPARVGRLNTAGAVRRELARVYREARKGELHPVMAARLTYVLTSILRCVEVETIEQRLGRLEQQLGEQR